MFYQNKKKQQQKKNIFQSKNDPFEAFDVPI